MVGAREGREEKNRARAKSEGMEEENPSARVKQGGGKRVIGQTREARETLQARAPNTKAIRHRKLPKLLILAAHSDSYHIRI